MPEDSKSSGGDAADREAFQLADPSTWSLGWTAILVPNLAMLTAHARGGSPIVFGTVLRTMGPGGLFVLPFFALAMEKSFYDTSLCLRAIDPNKRDPDREGEGFPSGGHALPSLSLVPLRETPINLRDILPAALFPKT